MLPPYVLSVGMHSQHSPKIILGENCSLRLAKRETVLPAYTIKAHGGKVRPPIGQI